MMADSWNVVETSLGATLAANILSQRVTYRLHEIVVRLERQGAVAEVYDGSGLVHTTHGATETDALARATAWVDEQDESLPEYDLHTG